MTMCKRLLKISDPIIMVLIMLLAGCANFSAVDKPIAEGTPYPPDRLAHQMASKRSDDLLVLLGFSGGGTRAAAYAYGLLKALADASIMTEHGQRSLLQEVDVISSVSGGNFTSAYYGLKGDGIFEDFEARFLRHDVEGALIGKLFNPVNWTAHERHIRPERYGRRILW